MDPQQPTAYKAQPSTTAAKGFLEVQLMGETPLDKRSAVWSGILVAVLGAFGFLSQTYISGDSVAVISGSEALRDCLVGGVQVGCTGTNQFGLPQYILSMVVEQRWGDASQSLGVLGWSNGLALVAYLTGIRTLFLSRQISPWIFLTFAISPALIYGANTFSEMLVLTAVVYWVLAVKTFRPMLAVLSAVIIFSSRETILLMVGPVLILYLLTLDRSRRSVGVVGIAAGTAVMFAFNTLKFGSLNNPVYSDPAFRTFDPKNVLSSMGGLFLSPSGGLALSWPLCLISLVIVARTPVELRASHFGRRFQGVVERRGLALAVAASLGIQIIVLSLWFAPFGWVAWGPRTLLPSLTLTILLAAIAGRSPHPRTRGGDGRSSHAMRRGRPLVLSASGAIVASLGAAPLLGYLMAGPRLVGDFVAPREPCIETPIIQGDSVYYFECLRAATWRWSGSQTQLSMDALGSLGLIATLLVFTASFLILERSC